MSTAEQLTEIYGLLFERFGPQHWWPGETRFEIIVGAILTQNTSWSNVEKAIDNLKAANMLDVNTLNNLPIEELAQLIKPAGYFNVKAKRLKSFMDWLFVEYGGELDSLEQLSTDQLREELLGVKGIGPETSDSIVLYAFDKPIFVVDAYTARVMARHELVEPPFDYEGLQMLFTSSLNEDVQLYNEYHALLVCVGKEFCKPKAKCPGCPLEKLPHHLEYKV